MSYLYLNLFAETPGYYLIGVRDGQQSCLDGAHSSLEGVANAVQLYKQLGFWDKHPDEHFHVVYVGRDLKEPDNE
jgi:hypothetical protein